MRSTALLFSLTCFHFHKTRLQGACRFGKSNGSYSTLDFSCFFWLRNKRSEVRCVMKWCSLSQSLSEPAR